MSKTQLINNSVNKHLHRDRKKRLRTRLIHFAGKQVYSVKSLTKSFNCYAKTIYNVLNSLAEEGYIYSVNGDFISLAKI